MIGRRRSRPVMKSVVKIDLGPTCWTEKGQVTAFTRLRSGVQGPLRPPMSVSVEHRDDTGVSVNGHGQVSSPSGHPFDLSVTDAPESAGNRPV
jgi:hypothetical protein